MARTKRGSAALCTSGVAWRTGLYTRLSREDGDKPEGDSISNQKKLLERFAAQYANLQVVELYADNGCTGTNWNC